MAGVGNALAEVASYVFLFLLMLGLSATVNFEDLVKQLTNRAAIGSGIAMQFVVMPLLGFLSVLLLGNFFSPAVGMTLLIVTASPGGTYSNWWCGLFNADLALSVAMTGLSTILSTFLLPLNLLMYSHLAYRNKAEDADLVGSMNWTSIFISIAVVLLAIVLGVYCSYRIRAAWFQRCANKVGNVSGILLIVVSLVLSSGSEDTRLWNQSLGFYIGVASPCIIGLAIANVFGKMTRLRDPERVTLSVESCYQNVGIATSVAMSMFDDPKLKGEALCVPIFYGLVEVVVLGTYCMVAWKMGWTKAARDERFCVMLSTSYEVPPEEPTSPEGTEKEQGPTRNEILDVDTDDSASVHSSSDDSLNSIV